MSSFIDLIGSIVIGGITLLFLAMLSIHISDRTRETVLSEIAQTSIKTVAESIEDDVAKMGYRVENGPKIISMSAIHLWFRGDIDNNGIIDTVAYTITAQYGEYVISRVSSLRSKVSWDVAASSVTLAYADSAGNSTTLPNLVRSIVINVTLADIPTPRKEAPRISNIQNPFTPAGAHWQRRFYPKNL